MASKRKINFARIEVGKEMADSIAFELQAIPNGVDRAISGAVNKTLPKGRTFAVNRLHKLLAVRKKGAITSSQGGNSRFAIVKATPSRPSGFLRILGRPIALWNFQVKDTRNKKRNTGQGVFYQLYRSGSRKRLPHAFIAAGEQGNKHVFQRATGAGRLPIFSHIGLSLYDVGTRDHPEVQAETQTMMADDFGRQILSQVDRLLGRKKTDR